MKTGNEGFTLLEMLITVSVAAILTAIGADSFATYREKTALNRAAQVVISDVHLMRSHAIRNRSTVWMVADESAATYEIKDAGGTILQARDFSPTSDVPLSSLSVVAVGDSLGFNSRGVLVNGLVLVDVARPSGTRRITITALGRTRVNTP